MPTPITRSAAVARVKALTDSVEFPEVVDALVEAFVDDAARPDAAGVVPTSSGWVPTYDLNAAVASVFETKAASVANRYDTNTDGQALNRSQMLAHFLAMGKMYRNRTSSKFRKAPYADLTNPDL